MNKTELLRLLDSTVNGYIELADDDESFAEIAESSIDILNNLITELIRKD